MFLDQLKLVSVERASRIAGVDSTVIVKATDKYTKTKGQQGLAYIILPGRKRKLIRLCAISDWLGSMEAVSRYA